MARRIGDDLEPLAIAYVEEIVDINGWPIVGDLVGIDVDFDAIVHVGNFGVRLAGIDKLVANPKCQKERLVGVSRVDPDTQVVGRLGARFTKKGTEPSGVRLVVKPGLDPGAVLTRIDPAVGDGASGT